MGRIKTTRRPARQSTADSPKRPLLHVADLIFNTPLMVHPNKLRVVLETLGDRFADPLSIANALSALPVESTLELNMGGLSLREPSNQRSYEVTDSGIALIPIEGMLMKKAAGLMAYSGMCTYEDITEQFSAAIDDPSVRAVLLAIDSPGGQTHGVFELSDLIHSARGSKPIYAAADDLAASAAYCIACSADRVFVTRTGAVGSIGVMSLHTDQSGLDAKLGMKYTYISAGKGKTEGNPHEPLSDKAYATVKAEVDRQYGMFVDAVARGRRISADAVVAAGAACYFADSAVPMLADQVGTLDDALEALEAKISTAPARSFTTSSGGSYAITLSQLQLADLNAGTPVTLTTIKETPSMSVPNTTATAPTVEEQLAALQKENAELKAKAAIAAAAPIPVVAAAAAPAEDCDDDEEEDPPMQATQQPVVIPITTAPAATARGKGRSAAVIIAELCTMNGADAQCSELIRAHAEGKKTVAQIREDFLAKRSAASHAHMTSNSHSANSPLGSPLDRMEQMAVTLVQNSGGKISKSKAYETVLKANPMVYRDYVEEKDEAALTPGRRRAYLEQMGPKMAAMGLGSQFIRQ